MSISYTRDQRKRFNDHLCHGLVSIAFTKRNEDGSPVTYELQGPADKKLLRRIERLFRALIRPEPSE